MQDGADRELMGGGDDRRTSAGGEPVGPRSPVVDGKRNDVHAGCGGDVAVRLEAGVLHRDASCTSRAQRAHE
jgi:hypothetical protein